MTDWCSSQLQDLCRLCGKYNSNMIFIFDEQNQHNYSKMINMHLHEIQVGNHSLVYFVSS